MRQVLIALAFAVAPAFAADAAREAEKLARAPDAPVVVSESKGGFRFGRGLDVPHFALYADRTVIYRVIKYSAGATMPTVTHQVMQLAEADYRALLARIAPEGMQNLAASYDAIRGTDPSVTLIHVWTRGHRKTVSVVGNDERRIPPEFQRADAAIAAFRANPPAGLSPRLWPEGKPFPHAAAWQ